MRIEWEEFDGLMSHVIYSPQVKWAATGEPILEMGSDWDGKVTWLGNGNAFHVAFRRYASGGFLDAVFEPTNGIFRIGGKDGKPEPLANARRRLEEEIEKTVRRISPPMAPMSLMDWLSAVFLAGGLIVIVVDWARKSNVPEKPRKEPPKIIREIPKPTR